MSKKLTALKARAKAFWNKLDDEDKLYLGIAAVVLITAIVIIVK